MNATNTALAAAQKQVSTGYRVADATDDGAAYAIAQSVRSTVGALTSANQQLGNVQGLLSTTQSGLNNISNTMASMRDVLVKLADSNVHGQRPHELLAQYQSLVVNVKTFIQDANYNGKTLIGDITRQQRVRSAGVAVVRNESGAIVRHRHVRRLGAVWLDQLHHDATAWLRRRCRRCHRHRAPARSSTSMNTVSNELNTIGSATNYVTNQVSYNSDKIDALNTGLGALVDADLAQGIGAAAGPADPSAVRHAGAVDRQPGAADPAEPVQVIA